MTSHKIALVLGAGPGVGIEFLKKFQSHGYRVALSSRSADSSKDDDKTLNLKADFSQPTTVTDVFNTIREKWGPPTVVLYNGNYLFALEHFTRR